MSVFHGSTLVAVNIIPPLIDALTGAPGMAFPRIRLGSGIIPGRGTESFHQADSSLGIFPGMRVFVTAFSYKNLAQNPPVVNPLDDFAGSMEREKPKNDKFNTVVTTVT